MAETDVIVRKQGTAYFFYVISIAASEWVEENMRETPRVSRHTLMVGEGHLFEVAAAMSHGGLRIKFEPTKYREEEVCC